MCDQTTKRVRAEGLDKFYTNASVVDHCLNILQSKYAWNEWDLVIEPSAGNGSFLSKIPSSKKIGMDILPEHPDIVKSDFFEYSIVAKNVLVIGNPPFGRVSSLALRFFNHAATMSNVIAFIIPRTFRRISIQNKLDRNFHLVFDEEIATNPCAFTPPMMVKCCFQIWEKRSYARENVILATTHPDWQVLPFGAMDANGQPTPPNGADFAIRAYGGCCGEIKQTNLGELRPKSWHWIKSNIATDVLIERFSKLDYSNSQNTARQNSMGKGELVALYSDFGNGGNLRFAPSAHLTT